MQKIKSTAFAMFIGIVAVGMTISSAKAIVIHSYTGNNFTIIQDSTPPVLSYTTSMSVSGSFTVAAPLLSLPAGTDISALVLDYSFNDGRQTFDSSNATTLAFNVSTDGAGDLLEWFINLDVPFSTPSFIGDIDSTLIIGTAATGVTRDRATRAFCTDEFDGSCRNAQQDVAEIFDRLGTWTRLPTNSVPEPSALLLFGVGLAGLAGIGWRRRQV